MLRSMNRKVVQLNVTGEEFDFIYVTVSTSIRPFRLQLGLAISMTFVEYLPRIQTTNVYTLNVHDVEDVNVKEGVMNISNIDDPVILTHSLENYTFSIIDGPVGKIIRFKEKYAQPIEEREYLWTIKEMKAYKSIRCAGCKTELINITKLKKILAMPSEMWAEMVDCWHCHKPNGSETMTKRFSGLNPGENSILVGSYYFIFNPENFNTISIVRDTVECRHCAAEIGIKDLDYGHYKLLKWNLQLDNESFDKWKFVYFRLLEDVKFTAVHKFTIVCGERYVKVWCFGAGIEVIIGQYRYRNGMKILYDDQEKRKEGEQVIEIDYPEVFDSFFECLKFAEPELTKYGLGKFGKWKVGYLADNIELIQQ